MIVSWKHVTRRVSISLSAVVLMVFLAACGGGGSTGSATPTPTSPASNPSPTTPSVAMQTFTGNGFTISYPQSWQKTSSNSQGLNQVAFHDETTGNAFTIVMTPDPEGAASADKIADTSVQTLSSVAVKNGKPATVPASTTINGITWSQRAITGTVAVNSQDVPAKVIVLVTIHPANSATSQAFELFYGGPTFTFDLVNTQIFQPMLQSFKFTA